jgi:hypothetical protein
LLKLHYFFVSKPTEWCMTGKCLHPWQHFKKFTLLLEPELILLLEPLNGV